MLPWKRQNLQYLLILETSSTFEAQFHPFAFHKLEIIDVEVESTGFW